MCHGTRFPAGEAKGQIETHRGLLRYALILEGDAMSCRTRTPSFARLKMLLMILPGMTGADLVGHIASLDLVLSDVDR
jgi:NADH-quinone oxidoreductase subunit C/D